MKNLKNIFGKINLVLFLSSFALIICSSFTSASNGTINHKIVQIDSKNNSDNGDSNQQTSENSEPEFEDDLDFELEYISLPFFVSVFNFEYKTTFTVYTEQLPKIFSEPIYLAFHKLLI